MITVLLCASAARAQPAGPVTEASTDILPVSFAERPLTLPRGLSRVDALFSGRSAQRRFRSGRDSSLHFLGTLGVGLGDDFEGGLVVLPLELVPDTRYEGIGAFGLGRYLRGDVEAGVFVEARMSFHHEDSIGQATIALPFLFRIAPGVRLDVVPRFLAVFGDSLETVLELPFSLTVQASDTFFAGLSTGLTVVDWQEGFGEDRRGNTFIPAGIFIGGTLRGPHGPRGDLRLAWLLPTVTDGTEEWVLSFGGSFFLY
jgi:hypothetical protein